MLWKVFTRIALRRVYFLKIMGASPPDPHALCARQGKWRFLCNLWEWMMCVIINHSSCIINDGVAWYMMFVFNINIRVPSLNGLYRTIELVLWFCPEGGGVMLITHWFKGGHMNSARAWPPFSGPQLFSNENCLIEIKYVSLFVKALGAEPILLSPFLSITHVSLDKNCLCYKLLHATFTPTISAAFRRQFSLSRRLSSKVH